VFIEAKDDGGGGNNRTTGAISRAKLQSNHHRQQTNIQFFRLDALALSIIAMATWLAGWLSHYGIVSKPLNLSENFLDHLKAPSL